MGVISLGKKTAPRIFVEREGQGYVVPYWISRKGNLCWQIGEVPYVKLKSGFTMMLEKGEWVLSDATTKADVANSRDIKGETLALEFSKSG